jgi:hypothetical protein
MRLASRLSLLLSAAPLLIAGGTSFGADAGDPLQRVRFTMERYKTGGENPFAACTVDLNGDGRIDLAITHAGSNTVTLLLARTAGGFGPPVGRWRVGKVPRGIVAADLDSDGKPDLVIAGNQANTVEVVLRAGTGNEVLKRLPARIAPFNVVVSDLNGDRHPDIAVANESNVSALEDRGEVSLLFGDGNAGFAVGPVLHAGTHPAHIKAADLNGDGKTDLAVVNWGSRDLSLFFGRGDGTFSTQRSVPYGEGASYALDVGDLDGDGDTDVAVGETSGLVRIFFNDGSGAFESTWSIRAQRGLRSLAIADLNGDGRNDIATANAAADSVTIALGVAGGAFAEPYHIAAGKHPRNITAADLNRDGRIDLVVTNIEDHDVSVLWNAGASGL